MIIGEQPLSAGEPTKEGKPIRRPVSSGFINRLSNALSPSIAANDLVTLTFAQASRPSGQEARSRWSVDGYQTSLAARHPASRELRCS